MKRICLFAVLGIFILAFAACEETKPVLGPRQEVTAFEQKSVEINKPANVQISCDSGNIEVYSWDKPKASFEITKKIQGFYAKEELERDLENFKIETKSEKGTIYLNVHYDGKNKMQQENSVDLTIYLPKRLLDVNVKLDTGNLVFYDDIRCDLDVRIGTANCNINRIKGNLIYKADRGNLSIEAGEISKKLDVKTIVGNISIKAAFAENGSYSISTDTGNIDVILPEGSEIGIQSSGTVTVNEFPEVEASTVLKVKSGMGRITMKKSDSMVYVR